MNLGDIDDRTVNECLKAGRQFARVHHAMGEGLF